MSHCMFGVGCLVLPAGALTLTAFLARRVLVSSRRATGVIPPRYFSTPSVDHVSPSKPLGVYINVPFEEKNTAKSLGARWDSDEKKWYVPFFLINDIQKFAHWRPRKAKGRDKISAMDASSDIPVYSLPRVKAKPASPVETHEACVQADAVIPQRVLRDIEINEKTEMVVFYDVETTGLPRAFRPNEPQYRQLKVMDGCRVVQMSYVVCAKESLQIVHTGDLIIKSDGFQIGNAEFHGVTQERSQSEGIPFAEAAKMFFSACTNVTHLVAHNAQFDIQATKSELYRLGLTDMIDELDRMQVVCSMAKTKPIVKCLNSRGSIKNPRLQELYEFATNQPMENAHNALHDVLNLRTALRVLVENNSLQNLFDEEGSENHDGA